MALDFPSSPTDGQTYGNYTYEAASTTWRYTGLFADTLPAGSILAWGGTAAPTNWLICDGSAVSRTTYATLYSVIGTFYGTGNGSTTFNLPNLKGKVTVGLDATDSNFNALGKTGGASTHTLTTDQIPLHAHQFGADDYIVDSGNYTLIGRWAYDATSSTSGNGVHALTKNMYAGNGNTTSTVGGQAHNNLQPYQVANYIIKTSMGTTQGDSQLATTVASLQTSINNVNDVDINSPSVGQSIVWNGTSWVNQTPAQTTPWVELSLFNGVTSYNESAKSIQYNHGAAGRFGKFVNLRGLLNLSTTVAGGTKVAELPVGYRPDTDMVFPCQHNNNTGSTAITVKANGDVVLGATFTANGWFSLDNIIFPAAGVATWTTIGATGSGSSFANGWVDYGTAAYGVARYWKDPDTGVVWFAGLIKSGTVGSVNAINLPSAYQSTKIQHHTVTANAASGGARVRNDTGGIDVYTGSNVWVSLASIVSYTADSNTLMTWREPRAMNGTNYNIASYHPVSYAVTNDNLFYMRGLQTPPASNTKIINIPPIARSYEQAVRVGFSGDGAYRMDIAGTNNSTTDDGSMYWVTNAAGWVSYDGIIFAGCDNNFKPKRI